MTALLLIAALILVAAAAAMTRRNLIHGALLLAVAWSGVAAFYLWAGAEFVAFAQVLIYVGAVSMIVLFAVLLTRQTELPSLGAESLLRAATALTAAGGVAGVMFGAILAAPFELAGTRPAAISVRQIGEALMGPHVAALLLVGVVLTVALVGAMVLAAPERDEEDQP